MALITNYTTLQTAISNFIRARADIVASVDVLIQLAETDIDSDLKLGGDELVSTSLATVAGTPYVALPAEFRGLRGLWLQTDARRLVQRTPSQVAELSANGNTDKPDSYAIIGNDGGTFRLMLGPTPGEIYTLEILYNKKRVALSTTSTNWLLTNFPNLYLFGALRNAAAFAIEDSRISLWQAGYNEAVAKCKARLEEIMFGGESLQMSVEGIWPESDS